MNQPQLWNIFLYKYYNYIQASKIENLSLHLDTWPYRFIIIKDLGWGLFKDICQ